MGQYERHRADLDQLPCKRISLLCSLPVLTIEQPTNKVARPSNACRIRLWPLRHPLYPWFGLKIPWRAGIEFCRHFGKGETLMTVFRKSPPLVLSRILVTTVAVTAPLSQVFGEGGAR